MDKNPINKKVFVGLSGGVDSSVSAALLKQAGFDVTAIFIKVWQPDWIECSWREERLEAMRAAAHLDIPFFTLDLSEEYKKDVIDYMIREYSAGRTPNPDVMCNRYVKFGAFLKWAKTKGADFVATGHYAINKKIINTDFSTPEYVLLAGTDKNKDQSYFLWTLNQTDLQSILFPVGSLIKAKVRQLAKKFKLPNADKKDSQGLCFIGKVDVKDFLKHYIGSVPGDVVNEKGEIIGHHPGSLLFTKGERHGFVLTKKTPHDAPYFVVGKDNDKNTLTVSNRNQEGILPNADKKVKISAVNWTKGLIPEKGLKLQVRSRYRQPLQKAEIVSANSSEAVLEFDKMQDTLSPGQSLVIYDGEECLGGGVIE